MTWSQNPVKGGLNRWFVFRSLNLAWGCLGWVKNSHSPPLIHPQRRGILSPSWNAWSMSVSCGPGGPEVELRRRWWGWKGSAFWSWPVWIFYDFFHVIWWFFTNSSNHSCRHTLGFLVGKETWAMWYETLNGKQGYLQFQIYDYTVSAWTRWLRLSLITIWHDITDFFLPGEIFWFM